MWSRHVAFIRGAWFNRLHQPRDGQFALKNWALTTWKNWPLQFEKVQQPWRLSWKLSAKYFMSFDASTAVAPPAVYKSHILPKLFLVWLFCTFSLSWLNKGQQILREHMELENNIQQISNIRNYNFNKICPWMDERDSMFNANIV